MTIRLRLAHPQDRQKEAGDPAVYITPKTLDDNVRRNATPSVDSGHSGASCGSLREW